MKQKERKTRERCKIWVRLTQKQKILDTQGIEPWAFRTQSIVETAKRM